MLGRDLVDVLSASGQAVTAATHADLDIRDPDACTGAVPGHDIVVNAAAWTAVDDAETHEGEAFAVNAVGAANLARACRSAGTRLIHISTDYVFDGLATTPYAEDAPLAPRSAYGRTKAAGEWAVRAEHPTETVVLRTAWLYGANGACFPRTIARLLRERETLRVVDDQVGQPTWTRDVAALAHELVARGVPNGVFHATASGRASWHAFAQAVASSTGADPARVRPCATADHARPAPRPAFSVLGHAALAGIGLPAIGDWRDRWAAAAAEVLA